jgi:lipoyl(octanoyl) transferase
LPLLKRIEQLCVSHNLSVVKEIVLEDLGLVAYGEAQAIQQKVLSERHLAQRPDTLLLLEHPKTLTLGRGTHPENLLDPTGFEVLQTERGGDITLHAPGQLVGYAIFDLNHRGRDLRAHLRWLEKLVMDALLSFGVHAGRVEDKTGVWIEDVRKIASLGIACRHWVSYHGFALNVSNDLRDFQAINPCGFTWDVMTSLGQECGRRVTVPEAKAAIRAALLAEG